MKIVSLSSNFFSVSIWTLASRILGFVRDILMAAFLGTGPLAEAFLVAFSLPNMFRRFFAEGALNMAFVPLFSKKLDVDTEDAHSFASETFVILGTGLLILTILAQICMPVLVFSMASGFYGDGRFDQAIDLGRITFPYILFISLAALISGILNASGKFKTAAAAPIILNIVLILSMISADFLKLEISLALAIAVPISGALQLFLVYRSARKIGFELKFRLPKLTPDIKKLMMIAFPAALAGGVVQINLLVGRQIASGTEGAIAWLSYADRLYQLPLGVVGIAVGIVLLPDLSRRLISDDFVGAQNAFNKSAEFALNLTIPASLALILIPIEIITTLFERGEFNAYDTKQTAIALAIYGIGLPAFVLQKVLQPIYFAREDTKTPFRFALIAMVLNALIAIGLEPKIGFISAAIATSTAGWSMLLLLWFGTRKFKGALKFDSNFYKKILTIIIASAIMGICILLSKESFKFYFIDPNMKYFGLIYLTSIGLTSYFFSRYVLNFLFFK